MDDIYWINTITELNDLLNQRNTKHPMVAVIDFSKMSLINNGFNKISSGFYSVMLKNNCHGKVRYGHQYCDFEKGTLLCMAPNQVITIEPGTKRQEDMTGWGLFFHPDILRGSHLASGIKEYTFFSYDVNEALHLSDDEKQVLVDCFLNIAKELERSIDKHSQGILVSGIELFLNYCARYYDRQFITRSGANKTILGKLEAELSYYFSSPSLKEKGLPTVKYLAGKMNLSPNYFSDLLKRETGKNAQEHIHYYLIEEAKNRLLLSELPISEIAYDLGFEYPQYFSKIFKKKTGVSPAEYRSKN